MHQLLWVHIQQSSKCNHKYTVKYDYTAKLAGTGDRSEYDTKNY